MNDIKSKKTAMMGLFLGLSLILSYVESFFPFFYGVPGMKLGLPNLVIVICMYIYDARSALLINVLRVLIAGFMFGNAFSIIYSLSGAFLSFAVMYLIKKTNRLSVLSVSAAGAVGHNAGQLIVACIVVSNFNLYLYFPALFLGGIITGIVIGIIAGQLIYRLERIMK